jgi:hypothetical protein
MNVLDLASLDITDADEPVAARQVRLICLRLPLCVGFWGNGGGKVGSTLGLVFVSDILEVCGGVISGTGHLVTRFCIKPSGLCHTKGHCTKKVMLINNTFYIKHT